MLTSYVECHHSSMGEAQQLASHSSEKLTATAHHGTTIATEVVYLILLSAPWYNCGSTSRWLWISYLEICVDQVQLEILMGMWDLTIFLSKYIASWHYLYSINSMFWCACAYYMIDYLLNHLVIVSLDCKQEFTLSMQMIIDLKKIFFHKLCIQ